MEPPKRIEPAKLGNYLEIMSKAVFQSGMSWKVIDTKCPGIREAFHDFDAHTVATMGESDIDALAQDTRVITEPGEANGDCRQCPVDAGVGRGARWVSELLALPRGL